MKKIPLKEERETFKSARILETLKQPTKKGLTLVVTATASSANNNPRAKNNE